MWIRKAFPLALAAAAMLTVAACGGKGRAGGDFTIDLYTGQDVLMGDAVTFESALELGRPIVLNFFGGDCPPCVVEMPRLEQAWRSYHDRVLFLSVDIGPYTGLGTYVEGATLVAELGITYPTGSTNDPSVIPGWGVSGLPETFFVSPDGTLSSRWRGLIGHAQLEEEIEVLLDE